MPKTSKDKLAPKLPVWVVASRRHRLSYAHVQMARELDMNPRKCGTQARQPRSRAVEGAPSGVIETLYEKRFDRSWPERVLSIESLARERKRKDPARREAKAALRAARNAQSAAPEQPRQEGDNTMSEYQWYEFITLDHHLSLEEMEELRSISTRAQITPTRFWNEYHWGDLKADPAKLLARYFDAFLYFANWGSRRFMLRFPAASVDVSQLGAYLPGGSARLNSVGPYVLVDLLIEPEDFQSYDEWFEGARLAALAPLRAELLQGDMSAAYLGWLLAVQTGELARSSREPPVPAGLGELSEPLRALMDFLHIDQDLIAAAAEGSPAVDVDEASLRTWVQTLPPQDKERWLLRAVEAPTHPVGAELRAAFRRHRANNKTKRRTVSSLLARASVLQGERREVEAKRAAEARRRAEAARKQHLSALAREGGKAWARLVRLIEGRKYADAATLTVDLRDAALASGRADDFEKRWEALRKQYSRRRNYLDAVKRRLESRS
ncbi:hypothetical protein [Haliangium ochraceum]|uniref:Uncharacterized protein n=1 Tax=Haliangium ochraceum (strain DSM 14365 / JCM 11303 / SMP-2) TaxID=502025 RepID=D0LS18_HALO1|nr:hypothetical protein [Haliangium ochraceum]ACY13715.1 hypothetical protein Hoch_1141 [Haliangium ochraceum DSM 14365]